MKKIVLIIFLFFVALSCKHTEYYNEKKYVAVDTTYNINGTEITTTRYILKKDIKK